MGMGAAIRKAWNGVSTVLVVLAVLLAILLGGVRLIGLQPYVVLSGSMEPTYPVGSLIYVKQTDSRQIQPGQAMTFLLDENLVATHRVVERVPDPEDPETIRYRTKGDANETEDGGLVHYKNVIGIPVFHIPYLGYLANFIQNPPGTYVTIALGAALLLVIFLPDLLFPEKTSDKKRKAAGQTEPPQI